MLLIDLIDVGVDGGVVPGKINAPSSGVLKIGVAGPVVT